MDKRIDREIVCGIYKITSPSKKVYIGQSRNIHKRWMGYKRFCGNKPVNGQFKLYHSFIKYGAKNHTYEIIHICDSSDLNRMEEYYVDLYDSFKGKHGLNAKGGGGSFGELSDEAKLKISLANKGRPSANKGRKFGPMSEAVKINMRLAAKNRKPQTEESKRKRSETLMGHPTPDWVKEKISKSLIGKSTGPKSEESKRKVSISNTGKKRSEETKQAYRDAKRKFWESPRGQEVKMLFREMYKGKPKNKSKTTTG